MQNTKNLQDDGSRWTLRFREADPLGKHTPTDEEIFVSWGATQIYQDATTP